MKPSFQRLLQQKHVWCLVEASLGRLSHLYQTLRHARTHDPKAQEKKKALREMCETLFREHTVLHGPFQGMKYPDTTVVGSAIYPKLLGSYEQELSDVIAEIIQQPYTAVVDVGSAEGYYAVGFGMRLKEAQIFAFDTNEDSLALCAQMGAMNGVQIQTGTFCDRSTLRNLDLGDRALIFCDCEGYEVELITSELAAELRQHDFLIETHDFIQIEITQKLLRALERTHTCTIIESTDDIHKAYHYDYPELDGLDLRERRRIVAEYRPRVMRWIYATASTQPSHQEIPVTDSSEHIEGHATA